MIFHKPFFLTAIMLTMLFLNGAHAQEIGSITITNDAAFALTDKLVSIPLQQAQHVFKNDGTHYAVFDNHNNEIPLQLNDLDGDAQWDEALVLINIKAKETVALKIKKQSTPSKYSPRTNVYFGKSLQEGAHVTSISSDTLLANKLPRTGLTPYQMDGPAWENDKSAYRHYDDGRNAHDVFGKTTTAMVMDNVGLTEDGVIKDTYHVLMDWGRDVLNVGKSLGCGGIAIKTDSITRLGVWPPALVNNVDTTICTVRSRGPIHGSLDFLYQHWHANATDYTVTHSISISPGFYGYKNQVAIAGVKGNEELVIGLVNVNNQNPLHELKLPGGWVALTTHDHQTYNREYILGLAIIVPAAQYLGYAEAPKEGAVTGMYYARMKVENNKPVNYYVVTGWELSDPKFKTREGFEAYVKEFTQQETAQLLVSVKGAKTRKIKE